PPPIVEELLTDEELPLADTKTDSRFRLSPSEVAPRAQKKGCLSTLLLFAGTGVVGAVARWLCA
ncbi:MAG TPA: hypothetical protein VKD71_09190, partial [Gemmataceae bacterium]|nr:hypothetical protein [Gemmataceae bacterium]